MFIFTLLMQILGNAKYIAQIIFLLDGTHQYFISHSQN